MKHYLATFSLAIILLCAAFALTLGLAKPFVGHHDGNNAIYRVAAINYLDKGVLAVKGGQLIQDSKHPIVISNFYTHHPPLISFALAGSILVFGDTEGSIRLVPIVFSLATLLIFYLLLRCFFNAQISLLSLLFWLITPMFLYFGKMADHEALTLFFIVLAVLGFVKRKKSLVYLAVFLGQWSGWPAYYLAGILALFMASPFLILLSFFDFSLFLAHVAMLTGSPLGGGLTDIFLFRTGVNDSIGKIQESYTLPSFLRQELSWLIAFFTFPQFLIAIFAGIISLIKVIKTNKLVISLKVWLIFIFVATVHVFLFKTGAHRHDYWLYYFLPVFSFGVALAADFFIKKFKRSNLIYAFCVVLLLVAFLRSFPFFVALQNIVE